MYNSLTPRAPSEKKKRLHACSECRRAKRACIGYPCKHCLTRNLVCEHPLYATNNNNLHSELLSPSVQPPPGLGSHSLVLQHVPLLSSPPRDALLTTTSEIHPPAIAGVSPVNGMMEASNTVLLKKEDDDPDVLCFLLNDGDDGGGATSVGGSRGPQDLFAASNPEQTEMNFGHSVSELNNVAWRNALLALFDQSLLPVLGYDVLHSCRNSTDLGASFASSETSKFLQVTMCLCVAAGTVGVDLQKKLELHARSLAARNFDNMEMGVAEGMTLLHLYYLGSNWRLSAHYAAVAESLLKIRDPSRALMSAMTTVTMTSGDTAMLWRDKLLKTSPMNAADYLLSGTMWLHSEIKARIPIARELWSTPAASLYTCGGDLRRYVDEIPISEDQEMMRIMANLIVDFDFAASLAFAPQEAWLIRFTIKCYQCYVLMSSGFRDQLGIIAREAATLTQPVHQRLRLLAASLVPFIFFIQAACEITENLADAEAMASLAKSIADYIPGKVF